MIQLKNENGIEKIVIENIVFLPRPGRIDDDGVLSQVAIEETVSNLMKEGALDDCPPFIYGITSTKKPAKIRLKYEAGVPKSVDVDCWVRAPTMDAALQSLGFDHGRGILVVAPSVDISEELRQKPVSYMHVNPFRKLSAFEGKVYDGSLNLPELEPFVCKRFGSVLGGAYSIDYYFNDSLFHKSKSANDAPAPRAGFHKDDCNFECVSVVHTGFTPGRDLVNYTAVELFRQNFDVELKYVKFVRGLRQILDR